MHDTLQRITDAIAGSQGHDAALHLMTNVPGFAPIIQTVHILAVSAVMGSIVLVDLKVLGAALRSQATPEVVRRLLPWTWWALPTLALSGLVSILARPVRYTMNPVFGIKLTLLVPAIALALVFQAHAREAGFWQERRIRARLIAAVSLLLWLGVAMAGRWIAYVDYLFPGE